MNRFIILKAKLGYNPHRDKKGRFASANSVSGKSAKDSGLKKKGNPGKEPSVEETEKVANVLGWDYNKEYRNPFSEKGSLLTTSAKLSKETGFSETEVRKGLMEWGVTSNNSYASINMQKSASEEFGVPMSIWQKRKKIQLEIETDRKRSFGIDETPENRDELISKEKKLLRTMYNETQKRFKDAGIDKVTVYRGVSLKDKIPAGQQAKLTSNTLESWSLSKNVASDVEFTGGSNNGNVIRMEVPVERVLSTYDTGFGTGYESELVIFGNSEDIGIVVE